VLAHYGAVALPCRVGHADRKGKVESAVGHAQATPLKGLPLRAAGGGSGPPRPLGGALGRHPHPRHRRGTGADPGPRSAPRCARSDGPDGAAAARPSPNRALAAPPGRSRPPADRGKERFALPTLGPRARSADLIQAPSGGSIAPWRCRYRATRPHSRAQARPANQPASASVGAHWGSLAKSPSRDAARPTGAPEQTVVSSPYSAALRSRPRRPPATWRRTCRPCVVQ
jgi:hypothetical protein